MGAGDTDWLGEGEAVEVLPETEGEGETVFSVLELPLSVPQAAREKRREKAVRNEIIFIVFIVGFLGFLWDKKYLLGLKLLYERALKLSSAKMLRDHNRLPLAELRRM